MNFSILLFLMDFQRLSTKLNTYNLGLIIRRSQVRVLVGPPTKSISYTSLAVTPQSIWTKFGPLPLIRDS